MEKFTDIIQSDKPILVDFFATWCGPCKSMAPVLDELKKKIGDEARIIKLDVDKNQSLAQEYNIRTVPTFIIFKEGKSLWRHSGLLQVNELEAKLKEFE
ncbi:MAG: thioredoxin [Bacteroidales bacterium]|nr:thioredoxin [Bacteroidales bacterium]